jgi:hypothetical protein
MTLQPHHPRTSSCRRRVSRRAAPVPVPSATAAAAASAAPAAASSLPVVAPAAAAPPPPLRLAMTLAPSLLMTSPDVRHSAWSTT